MNRFDEKYEIRLARLSDVDAIMKFIDENWKQGHLMAQNRQYFEYEFRCGEIIHFIIAIERDSGQIQAILGYLYSSHTEGKQDAWGSIWKVDNTKGNNFFLGVEIMKRFQKMTNFRYRCGVGANPKTNLPIAKSIFKYTPVKLQQFYIRNYNIDTYEIAQFGNEENGVNIILHSEQAIITKINSIDQIKIENIVKDKDVPYKDLWFIEHRYFKHPWYEYEVFSIHKDNCVYDALMILRKNEVEDACIYRVVDYIGNHSLLSGAGAFFQELLKTSGAEYIDFCEYGFETEYLQNAGFMERIDEEVVLPNYFEPFVRKNIDIWGFYSKEGTVLMKGDGDQDRPNVNRGDWNRFGDWKKVIEL